MSELEGKNEHLNERIKSVLCISTTHLNLASLLMGFTISALFIYIIRPVGYQLSPSDYAVIILLGIDIMLYIAGIFILSSVFEKVSHLRIEINDVELLESKIKMYESYLSYAKKCYFGGLSLMISIIFWLIFTINGYLAIFMGLVILLLFSFVGLYKFKYQEQARLKSDKND